MPFSTHYPHYKQILCLAASRKYNGYCIAGKELADGRIGGWIRPVSDSATGELGANHIMFNGTPPRPLDLLTVPLAGRRSHRYQGENFLVARNRAWERSHRLRIEALGKFCDQPDSLWENGSNSYNGVNDRIEFGRVENHITSSLCLVKVADMSIQVGNELEKRKVRARFTYNHASYCLVVTDPVVEAQFRGRPDGRYPITSGEVLVVVSISEPYNGFCYKLVAAIINRELLAAAGEAAGPATHPARFAFDRRAAYPGHDYQIGVF